MSKEYPLNNKIEVMRAEEEWQRAGAYSVRIEGMNRQHHISLRDEFDELDGPGTKYIVLLDDGYPVATCRFFDAGGGMANIGRMVVLPEYRGRELGAKAMSEAISSSPFHAAKPFSKRYRLLTRTSALRPVRLSMPRVTRCT